LIEQLIQSIEILTDFKSVCLYKVIARVFKYQSHFVQYLRNFKEIKTCEHLETF